MGALAGGAAGAYGGHQLGHGVIGTLGGAFVGSKLEDTYKHHHSTSPQPDPALVQEAKVHGPWPLHLSKGSTIIFEYYPTGVEKDKKMGKIHSYALIQPKTSISKPYYTATYVNDKRFGKHAGLRMYRESQWIASCSYHSSGNLKPKHPWVEWEKWDPQVDPWISDTGTLPGQDLRWDYRWEDKPARERNYECIIRCAWDDDKTREVARLVMYTDEQGKIEIPSDLVSTQDQLDELVSHCFMQMQRKKNGYSTGSIGSSGGSSGSNENSFGFQLGQAFVNGMAGAN